MKSRLFQNTVIRLDSNLNLWYLMNKADKGWNTMALGPYTELSQIFESWDIEIIGASRDDAGHYFIVSNNKDLS